MRSVTRPCRPLQPRVWGAVVLWLGAVLLLPSACSSSSAAGSPTAKGTVNVAYAGSLVNLMEHKVGPAFDTATGYTFQGKGAGSTALANQIKSQLIHP